MDYALKEVRVTAYREGPGSTEDKPSERIKMSDARGALSYSQVYFGFN